MFWNACTSLILQSLTMSGLVLTSSTSRYILFPCIYSDSVFVRKQSERTFL